MLRLGSSLQLEQADGHHTRQLGSTCPSLEKERLREMAQSLLKEAEREAQVNFEPADREQLDGVMLRLGEI